MSLIYPHASWLNNGQSGGSMVGGPPRGVIHTTETRGVPSYGGGRYAPHVTYSPTTRRFYQHTAFDRAARALVNGPNPAQTNRQGSVCVQLEIICYSARNIAERVDGLWVADLAPEHHADLRSFIGWCADELGIPAVRYNRQALSYAEANAPGFRMHFDEWIDYSGWCGHQHIPDGNTHWDPGALNWDALFTKETDEMPAFPRLGDNGDHVAYWQGKAVDLNATVPDGDERRAYTDDDIDGDYGPNTAEALASAAGRVLPVNALTPPIARRIERRLIKRITDQRDDVSGPPIDDLVDFVTHSELDQALDSLAIVRHDAETTE